MPVHVYGINHVAIATTDVEATVAFYQDVFGLEMLTGGEGAAWCKVGEHQFMAIFECHEKIPMQMRHFGFIVRDEGQLQEVRHKLTQKYGITPEPYFRCDFEDPWGNHIQVVDLHDESLVWLLPYQEVQKAGIVFSDTADRSAEDPAIDAFGKPPTANEQR